MARFLDSTSSIKKEAGKKKKKQETTQPKQTTQSPSYSQKVQQTNQRLTQKYGGGGSGGSTRTTTSRTNPDQRTTQAQNQKMYGQPTQPVRRNQAELQRQKEERRSRAQEQKSGNFERPISRAQYADKRRATSFREKYTRWDNDIAETVGHTLRQTVAEDKRYLNRAAKGITMKDRHQWATPEQIRKADERTERRDRKYASQIEKEGQELEKLKQGHSYLGQQALSATSSATGMAADLAVGALTGTGEAGSLGHMFMRSTGGAYGQVNKKAASLRKQLEASGNYTPDELDEMFKDVNKRDELNAMASGGIEVLSELMFRGFGPAAKYVGKGGGIAERAAGKLFKKAGGRATSGIVKNALRGTAEEVAEEEIGGPLQALAANTIYGNKYQKYSEDAVKRDFKAQSDELRSQIHSDEDAQMVTARLNSDAFMNDSIKAYMDSGMSEDEARQMAEMSREYLTASLSGDIDKMSEMQNKLVDKLAGGENTLKEKFTLRDAVDAAVSTSMMTMTTGVPGAISTAQAGRAYKGTQGLEGVRNLAEVVRNWDTEESAKAQKIIDAIDNGSDVSDTQVYELIQKAGSAAEAQSEAETTKDQIAQKGMEKYDLRVAPAVRDEYGDVTLSENTQQRYDKIVNDTVSRYDSLAKLGESERFEKAHVKQGASLAAAQMTGVITAEDVHELVKADPEVKAVFQDVTGIALDQFTEYDKNGNIDVAATNNSMMNALMAEAATNYINSARLEQAAWANDVRGEMLQTMSDNLNSKGDEALFDALQNIDPRDRDTFMLTGMASQYVYEHGWSTQDTWEEAKGDLQRMFPSLSVDSLQGVYEAAKEDRIESETPFLNAQVVKDEALTELAKSGQKAEVRGKFKNRTKRVLNAEETVICTSLAKQFNANITMVGEKNKNLSYIDENGEEKFSNAAVVLSKGEIYISKKADISKIIHEVTHMGAKLASTQYLDMAHYIMDKAYKHSPERTRMLVEAYKRTYQGQNLTDAQIEEEVVADIVTAFEHDRVFLREIAQEEPSLFRRIYNAICDVIRTLRNILSTGRVLDPELQETFLAEIGAYEETRRMWLDMMHEAARNNAVVGLAEWENNAYKDSRSQDNEYEGERFSLVTDPETIAKLEADSHINTYRAMALIDGKLYPPMATKVKGDSGEWKLQQGLELGQWVESDATTDSRMFNKKGQFHLMKDNGDDLWVAYNPYIHSSDSMMNDQFSSYHKRPNLVVVEGEIPESEISNGYRAETTLDDGRIIQAKDTTGPTQKWNSGDVFKQLKKVGKPRTVYLTNHFKPTRIVPDSEVAEHINGLIDGTDIAIPYNVVPSGVRKELLKIGAKTEQNEQEKYHVDLDEEDLALIEQNPNATRYSLDAEDGYNIKDGKARWTDDRIDYIIRDNSEKFTNKTHAWATMINPRDFLKLTLRDEYLDKWNESAQNVPEEVKGMSYAEADEYVYQKFRETGEWIHDNENYPLDEDELRNERTTPFLKILQVGNSVNVDGHEGRHRMRALMEAGIESVPVLITTSGRNEKSKIKSLTLRSQDYGFPGPVNNGATVTVGDLVPVTEDHRNELVQKFGGDAQVRFSITPEQQETIEHNVGPDVRFSVPTWRETLAKAIFNSSEGFSAYSGKQSGMQITYDLTKNNFSEEQAKAVTDYMDMMAAWFEKTGEGSIRAKYKFIGWDDLTKAEVQVRKNDKNEIVSLTVSAMVKNGEYPVNFDLTTVCNKREGFSEVIKNLIDTKVPGTNENVLNTIKLTDKNMWKINQALKAEGIDTACLGCFVEARRYYAQNFMNKIDDKWNNAVRKARRELGLPEEEYFNFAKGKEVSGEEWSAIDDLWSAYDESKESKSSPADRIKILMDEIVKNKETDSPYLKLIQMSDISTPEGYNAFKQLSTKGHDMVKTIKSIYGTSAPKEILAFTPYNSEIALLPVNMKGMETGEYLKSIGGIRVQSFSDFKIEHVFDHFQMVADEAARKFVTHGYSKVIAFPRIFGLTGRKINMSVMFDVLPNRAWSQVLGIPVRKAAKYAKKYQGLQFVKEKPAENPDNRPYIETEIEGVHGYLTYLVSDTDYVNSVRDREYQKNLDAGMSEDEARRKANEAKPFEQSINYKDAVELENQDGYKENIGIIAVAYGDEHLKVLMSDPNVRYIIPYHKSGLPTFISKKTSLAIARDYTNFQNTNIAESWKDANGKEVDFRKEFNKFVKEHKDEKYPAIEFFKQINDNKYKVKFGSKTASQKSEMAGTADFDVYKDLDSVKDIREVSNAYLEHCIKNGWCPVFHEFAGDPNYYKMIFDFAVTDGTTTNIYPQRAVRNNYPGLDIDAKVAAGEEITEEDLAKLKEAVEKGAKEQNDKNMIRSNNMGNVMNDLLSRDTENSIIADTNLQSIRWNTPDYTDVKLGNEEMTPEETDDDVRLSISVDLDDAYMDAVNSNNMEEAQRLVDEAAGKAGMRVAHRYHGTMNAGFTVFDKAYAKVGGNSGAGFYFSTEKDDSVNHYADVEGADNYFKWSSLAEHINDQINEGTWEGPELETYEDVEEYAKEQLNKNPGTYDVYLNYKNPYIRDYKNSTNIYDMLMDDFDESVIDRDDYEDEWEYEDAVWEAKAEHLSDSLYSAVYGAYQDIEDNYEVIDMPYIDEVLSKITEYAFDGSLTWEEIQNGIVFAGEVEVTNPNWTDSGDATSEFTRAIIENLGFDAIEDKEVNSKFGQLSREMMTDTEHIIVFKPEQIKLSDPVTYAEDGSVIPLSERFDPNNNDIRYSMPTQDSDGNILTDGQMEYFKNSQARDEQGRLVRVFHSTDKGGFTVFDPMESNDHRSLFFTSLRRMSESYIRTGQKGDINPYEENAVIRSIKNVDELPEFISDEVTKRARDNISNIRVVDNDGGEVIAEGDDFVEVAKSIVQHLEQRGIDAEEDLMILPDILYDDSNPAQMGEAWEVYNELRSIDGFYSYTMDYADHGDAGTYTCYLNLENPLIIDARGHYWNDIPFDERRGYYKTRELAELAQNEGFDGVIIHNVVDYGSSGYGNDPADVYIAFSSNQVKDTRNENPSENPDIRYSKVDPDEAMSRAAHDYAYDTSHEMLLYYEDIINNLQDKDAASAYKKAQKFAEKDVDKFYAGLQWYSDGIKFDDAVLEEGRERMASSKADFFASNEARWNERWLTEGRVLEARSVRSPIRKLVMSVMQNSDTNSKYKTDLVNKTIVDARMAYYYAKQGRTDIADAMLWHSALRMIEDVDFIDDTVFKDYKDLRDYLRTTKISLNEKYWADIDYQAFRKRNYNKINLVSGETNVHQIYQEMCELWPEWFKEDEEMTPPDQLARIEQVLDAIQPYRIAYSSEEAAEMAFDIASDLTRIIREDGKEYKSIADRYKEKYDQKTKALKERHQEALREANEKQKDLEKKAKAQFKEYKAEQREKKYHDKYFDSIQKTHKELTKRLLTNTKDKHIPEQYKRELANLLAAFDFQTVRSKKLEMKEGADGYVRRDVSSKKTIQMRMLQGTLRGIENSTQMFRLNDSITDIMDNLLGTELGTYSEAMNVEGKTIDELNSDQLKKIDKMLKALLHEFNSYEDVRVGKKKEKAAKIGAAQIESSLAHAAKYGVGKDYHNFMGALDRIVNMDELTPAYLFRQVDAEGDGIGIMFGELRKSFDRYVRNQAQLNEWIGEIVGKYHEKGILWNKYGSGELTKWRSVNYQKEFMLENGKSVKLTPAQMMSIHCLAKRTQAYNHMTGAGIVVKPVAFEAKLISDLKQKGEWALPRKLTDNDIRMIENELTPEQIDVADKLQELMATKMAEWGNEASMNVLGIRLFEDNDYFPIKSDKSALEKDFDPQQFNEMIKNFGFTKAVAPGARNAIAIDDIFDVVAEHCNNMNLYNAYTEALNDFTKVYNYHQLGPDDSDYSVEQAIAHAYSQKATTFIRTFIQDLNGNVSRGRASGLNDIMNDMLGKAKKASVFANGRVALQQPTALFRAFAVIDPKYIKGAKAPTKANLQEMFDHCPIALWKSWGYYDINMGKSVEDLMMNNGSWAEDKMSDIYGKLDNATWCVLWNMCKAEVKEKNADVKEGTEEYWELCNKRMTEVVDLTQVVDSPFHRSHAMRSKDILHKMSTAFMAEPTLTFNMVRDGIKRAHEAYADKDYAKASKILGRTASVFVIQAAAVAGAAAIWDVLRDKGQGNGDDDKMSAFNLWWMDAVENFKDNLNLFNNVYYVKDIVSLFQGWDQKNLGLQGFVHLRDAWFQLSGTKKSYSKLTWYQNALAGIGYLTGTPYKTIMNDGKAILNILGIHPGILDSFDSQLTNFQSAVQDLMGGEASANGFTKTSYDGGSKTTDEKKEAKADSNEPALPTSVRGWTYDEAPFHVEDGSLADKFLNHFGVNLTAAEISAIEEAEAEKKLKAKIDDIKAKTESLSGEEKDKKVWSYVQSYMKAENGDKSWSELVAEGDYASIGSIEAMYVRAGGNSEYFDGRIMAESKSALKKSISSDNTPEQIQAQAQIRDYLLNNGMEPAEVSEIAYKSYTARDLKVAFRINDKEAMLTELRALVQAGLTEEDYQKLWDNRNRLDIKKYKESGGKYADRLKSTGVYNWPINGSITSRFGHRSSPGGVGSTNHQGLDIAGSMGDPVGASDGGTVVYAGWYGGAGKTVMIEHDDGTVTQYSHLSWYDAQPGDIVAQGQYIGKVGSTGNSTGPHLHFGVKVNGVYQDPETYLANR